MEKTSANLNNSLVQQLQRMQTDGASSRSAAVANSTVNLAPNQASSASLAQLNLPPALRQLLTEHGKVQQLLPQLKTLQQTLHSMPNTSLAGLINSPLGTDPTPQANTAQRTLLSALLLTRLLPGLIQQLNRSADSLTPAQLRSLVSQWFSTNPVRALTTPIGTTLANPSTGAPASTPMLSAGVLQWLLAQRSGHTGLTQLLSQQLTQQLTQHANQQLALQQGVATSQTAIGAGASSLATGHSVNALLNSFATTLQGSLQDIRLSQIHLADTSAALQPEYYLVIPYQIGDKPLELEWRLRKEARKLAQSSVEVWYFTLRLTTQRFGAMLVKGSYQVEDTGDKTSQSLEAGISTLRFYLSDNQGDQREAFTAALQHLRQRLQGVGLNQVEHEVHIGVIPHTLAPAAGSFKQQTQPSGCKPTRDTYGR